MITGLQIRIPLFDSGRGLQQNPRKSRLLMRRRCATFAHIVPFARIVRTKSEPAALPHPNIVGTATTTRSANVSRAGRAPFSWPARVFIVSRRAQRVICVRA